MRTLIVLAAALALASCGAKDLRTKEEAATAAAAEAVQDQQEAAAAEAKQIVEASVELQVASDPLTGCQYLVTSTGGITPRVKYIGNNSYGYHYEHVGCSKP